jgi:16S rRNA (cytosine967-C5)-methyltransferase
MVRINAREVAAQVLLEIEKDDAFSNLALKKALKANGAMPEKDRAFVTEIVNGCLRNIIYIDYVINEFSSVKTQKLKPWILAVMRISVYQLIFMNVPQSAAIDEAVKLIKGKGLSALSGFVNGVLRSIARGCESIKLPDKEKCFAEYVSVKYSHPLWLVKMWISYYGKEFTERLCMADTCSAPVCASVNTIKNGSESLINTLEKEGMSVKKAKYAANTIYISKTGNISKSKAFNDGLFFVQDESSAIASKVLAPQKGETVLDCCSAPGGKAMAMAMLMENSGKIVSRDIYEHKLDLINEAAQRLGVKIIETQLKDASSKYEEDCEEFDRVLIDAPCSGLGLLRKKADIRLKKDGNDIDALIALQRKILENCCGYVKKGGYLLYSTCTLSKKENTGNVKWLCDNFDFETVDITDDLPENLKSDTAKNGYIELYPSVHGTDGFFIAKLRRKES